MTDPELFESRWYRTCSPTQALAGLALRARSVKQEPAGSFPDDDVELAYLSDFGRDVDGWKAAKTKVLEGWVLCADDRWHHPEIARNVLHIWLGRLDARRVSAWASASKGKDGGDYGLGSILDDIDDALAALRDLDPQDALLRKATKVASEWRKRVAEFLSPASEAPEAGATAASPTPIRSPIGPSNRRPAGGSPKRSEAKVSEARPDSDMPGRWPGDPLSVSGQNSAEGILSADVPFDIASSYPEDAFARFYNRFPLKVGRKRAEAAFVKVRDSALVAFPDLLTGLERYIRDKPRNQDCCHPTTWLQGERWRDGLPLPEASPPDAGPGEASEVFVAVDTPEWVAWKREAQRAGRPGWPNCERGSLRGWNFPSRGRPGTTRRRTEAHEVDAPLLALSHAAGAAPSAQASPACSAAQSLNGDHQLHLPGRLEQRYALDPNLARLDTALFVTVDLFQLGLNL